MKSGMVFLLLGVLAVSCSVVTSPPDYSNLTLGIALFACGSGLLLMRTTEKQEINPLDSISLDSFNAVNSGKNAERLIDRVTEQIAGETIDETASQSTRETASNEADRRDNPVSQSRKGQNISTDLLIEKAHSYLYDRSSIDID